MSFRDDSTGIASADDMRDAMTGNNAPASPFDGYDDPAEHPNSYFEAMEERAKALVRDHPDTGEYAAEWTQRFNGKVA